MILFLSAYPPRECGLASFSYQLIQALKEHFDSRSLTFEICALDEGKDEKRVYPEEVRYTLNTTDLAACKQMAQVINADKRIKAVCIQHRFGFWGGNRWGETILSFLQELEKPLIVIFHNVLPEPDRGLYRLVNAICKRADFLITQTKHQAALLMQYYQVQQERVRTIPPGAAVVPSFNKEVLREKHALEGKFVLSSFGLLRRSKGIEHILEALDSIRLEYPEVVYLILGKTHPTASHYEGERYRIQLKDLIFRKGLQKHVRFVNRDIGSAELQEYLCLSDLYIHNSKQNLAVLMQAAACGCEIIAPELPAIEELLETQVKRIDLQNAKAIGFAVMKIIQKQMRARAAMQQDIVPSQFFSWPDAALAYQEVIRELVPLRVQYKLPPLKADHLYRLTSSIGLQHTDKYELLGLTTAYQIKDNAKALVAALLWLRQEPQHELLLLMLIRRFVNMIRKCQQPDGSFQGCLDDQGDYVPEVDKSQAEENSMHALWALSMLISRHEHLPADLPSLAQRMFNKSLPQIAKVNSLPAIVFAIKALSLYNEVHRNEAISNKIIELAAKMLAFFKESESKEWDWFKQEAGPGNILLSEALLIAWQLTGQAAYKEMTDHAFQLLMKRLFIMETTPLSQKPELQLMKEERFIPDSSPLEVCYTVMMLDRFYQQTGEQEYLDKMHSAFSWFLGNNDLHLSLYNPATGACYDGIRNGKLSQHQGAESLLSYLLCRLTLDKYKLQLQSVQQQAAPVRKLSVMQGVLADRPSMPSGKVKLIVN